MARVLMVGIDPDEVDFSDPALPPGLDADKIRAGIALAMKQLETAGHVPSQMFVPADPGRTDAFADRLASNPVDCVTIGGGVTRPPKNLELLEAILNVIARTSPTPRIALVSKPEAALEAVNRVLR